MDTSTIPESLRQTVAQAIDTSQKAMSDAFNAYGDVLGELRLDKLASFVPFDAPAPKAIVNQVFDLGEKVLATQRSVASRLVAAVPTWGTPKS